jgi:hypothetical protein
MRSLSIVLLSAVLPLALHAQSAASTEIRNTAAITEPAATTSQISAPTSKLLSTEDTGDASQPPAATVSASETGDPGQQSKSPTQTSKPSKPKPSDSDRPPIEGSMVGYIDNAIVGNEVRVRFDAGFGDNAPDRAEFFYAQCGCDLNGARGPAPGLALNLNFQQLYLRAEYAPIKRLSFMAEVPIRWLQPLEFVAKTIPNGGFGNQSGISDFSAGFKFAMLASRRQYLTFQMVAIFPSGDSTRGLGTGHYSVVPSVLYYQKFTDRWSLEAQLGDTHPISSSGSLDFAGDVFTYGIGPSYEVYRGEKVRFAPVVELVGWHVLGGMQNSGAELLNTGQPLINVDGVNIVNLKVGARTTIGSHNSIYAGFGQALTHDLWYRHIVRIEYRYTF